MASGHLRIARTPANINKVEDFALSEEDKPWKQFRIKKLCDKLAYF